MTGRGLARTGLFQTAAGVGSTVTLATSAVRHVGWWLEWQTRGRVADGSRALPETYRADPPEVLSADVRAI